MKAKSNKYWEKRAVDRHLNSERKLSNYEDDIRKAYDQAMRELGADMNTIVRNYQNYVKKRFDLVLNQEDTTLFLNAVVDPGTMNTLRHRWKKRGVDIDAVLAQTGNYTSRITNKQLYRKSVDLLMDEVARREVNISKIAYTDLINDTYNRKIFDISKGTGLDLSMQSIDLEQIQEIMDMNWSGNMFSERIWGNRNLVAKDLKSIFTVQMLNHRPTNMLTDDLDNYSLKSKYTSARLIRTEMAAMRTATEKQAAIDLGITHYRNVAVLDLKTSLVCQSEDGKEYLYSKQERGVNAPPFHPWCRTITQDVFEDVDYSKIERIARDPETGETEYVPADVTYPEWIKHKRDKHGDSQVDTWIKMVKNEGRDRSQHQRYRNVLGEYAPKKFEEFQKTKYNSYRSWSELKHDYSLKKHYDKSIRNGNVSALVDFGLYRERDKEIATELYGITTSDGVKVKSHSKHFIDRTFGSISQKRSGVAISVIKNTLMTGTTKVRNASTRYQSTECNVSVNQITGKLIQTNPYHRKKVKK